MANCLGEPIDQYLTPHGKHDLWGLWYNDKIEAEHLLQDKRASSWTGQRKALVKSDGKVCMLSNFHQFVGRFMTFGICL